MLGCRLWLICSERDDNYIDEGIGGCLLAWYKDLSPSGSRVQFIPSYNQVHSAVNLIGGWNKLILVKKTFKLSSPCGQTARMSFIYLHQMVGLASSVVEGQCPASKGN